MLIIAAECLKHQGCDVKHLLISHFWIWRKTELLLQMKRETVERTKIFITAKKWVFFIFQTVFGFYPTPIFLTQPSMPCALVRRSMVNQILYYFGNFPKRLCNFLFLDHASLLLLTGIMVVWDLGNSPVRLLVVHMNISMSLHPEFGEHKFIFDQQRG